MSCHLNGIDFVAGGSGREGSENRFRLALHDPQQGSSGTGGLAFALLPFLVSGRARAEDSGHFILHHIELWRIAFASTDTLYKDIATIDILRTHVDSEENVDTSSSRTGAATGCVPGGFTSLADLRHETARSKLRQEFQLSASIKNAEMNATRSLGASLTSSAEVDERYVQNMRARK